MSLQQICRQVLRFSRPASMRCAAFHEGAASPKEEMKENSAEYSSDGEKIYCDLKFRAQGDKTEEELAFILESARAKAFAESTNRVVNINKSD